VACTLSRLQAASARTLLARPTGSMQAACTSSLAGQSAHQIKRPPPLSEARSKPVGLVLHVIDWSQARLAVLSCSQPKPNQAWGVLQDAAMPD
jgi:hypothetical protein